MILDPSPSKNSSTALHLHFNFPVDFKEQRSSTNHFSKDENTRGVY